MLYLPTVVNRFPAWHNRRQGSEDAGVGGLEGGMVPHIHVRSLQVVGQPLLHPFSGVVVTVKCVPCVRCR